MSDTPQPSLPVSWWARTGRLLVLVILVLALLAWIVHFYGPRIRCFFGTDQRGCPGAAPTHADDEDGAVAPATAGPFLLRLDSGVELDTDPASEVTAAGGHLDDGDLFFDDRRPPSNALYTADHPVAEWLGDSAPDAADCLDAIVNAGTFGVDPRPGQVLCVQTTEGRIAALTVSQVLNDGVTFVSTVWD